MEKNKKEENPLVSIIVPCYNQAQYLPEALNSVLAQSYINWECVIINDGSCDNTDEVAKEYCAKDSRFKYHKQDNQGVSAARNNGIKFSHGKYILPLDGDDKIACSYVEKAVRYFQKYPETKIVYCKCRLFGDINVPWDLPEYRYENFIWQNSIFCSAMFSRDNYDKTGGYNLNMRGGLEDWDFMLSLLKPEDSVYQIPDELFFYRQHGVSRNSQVHLIEKELLRQIVHNHIDIYQSFFSDVISYKSEIMELEDNLQLSHSQLMQTRSSRAFRLGKFLLHPGIRTLQALLYSKI